MMHTHALFIPQFFIVLFGWYNSDDSSFLTTKRIVLKVSKLVFEKLKIK